MIRRRTAELRKAEVVKANVRPAKRITKNACKACEGTGVSSSGHACLPCRGSGQDLANKVWTCPLCGKDHEGFVENKCRNKDCYGSKGGR
jgi:hypothetical protein